MASCRKKPVVVQAEQFWPDKQPWPQGVYELAPTGDPMLAQEMFCIDTLEGTVYVRPGDWVICGVAGERYPCRDDIFRATYEWVGGDEHGDDDGGDR